MWSLNLTMRRLWSIVRWRPGIPGNIFCHCIIPLRRLLPIIRIRSMCISGSSDEQIEVIAKYQGQEVKTVKLETVFRNAPTTTEFTKSDITTGVELDGATLTILDSDGKEVEKWTSVKGKAHVIKRLHVGENYTLREEFAPYGYLQAEEVKFTVSDTADVQKVEMKDAVPVGRR